MYAHRPVGHAIGMQPPSSLAEPVELQPWQGRPAVQQPDWLDDPAYRDSCDALASAAPLVTGAEVRHLRGVLSRLGASGELLLQLGDCAESFYECTPWHTMRKLEVMDQLADRLGDLTGRTVVQVGRMGGQFAKPRSQAVEAAGTLPLFRGHMINSDVATPLTRRPDPRRMVWAYEAGEGVQRVLRAYRERELRTPGHGPWSSHEALVIDYEAGLLRRDADTGQAYLGSTHLPWIGERTRRADGAHVALLSTVVNAVGCKIGPQASADEIVQLCQVLDPGREPGRLILIPRMGRDRIQEALPPIVRAVAAAGHPVIWLSDPMHGNTVKSATGPKTRRLADVITEALRCRDILDAHREYAAGLHIEVAADDVTECVGGSVRDEDELHRRYTSLCDPRLNPSQAAELVEAWAKGTAGRR